MERWKDIAGWEGVYQISNHGRLKSFKKDKDGNILSNKNSTGRYFSVVLCSQDRKSFSTRIHRLVAEYFIPNPLNKKEVNHKDSNKQNNHVKNLEWVTSAENNAHAIAFNPKKLDGMIHHNKIIKTKDIMQFDMHGNFVERFKDGVEAAASTGVCHRNIMQVASKSEYKPGKTRKQAGGFVWKYADEIQL